MATSPGKSTVDLVNEAIDSAPMTSNELKESADELSAQMQAYTDRLSAEVERYVSEGIETFQKAASVYSEKLSENAAQAADQARKALGEGKAYVRDYPTPTVLGAFAIGVLLGALIRRS